MDWLAGHGLDVFGWLGSGLLVFSLLQTRILRFRILNLAACLSLVLFNVLIQVWPMVGMNVATSSINVWFLVKGEEALPPREKGWRFLPVVARRFAITVR